MHSLRALGMRRPEPTHTREAEISSVPPVQRLGAAASLGWIGPDSIGFASRVPTQGMSLCLQAASRPCCKPLALGRALAVRRTRGHSHTRQHQELALNLELDTQELAL